MRGEGCELLGLGRWVGRGRKAAAGGEAHQRIAARARVRCASPAVIEPVEAAQCSLAAMPARAQNARGAAAQDLLADTAADAGQALATAPCKVERHYGTSRLRGDVPALMGLASAIGSIRLMASWR